MCELLLFSVLNKLYHLSPTSQKMTSNIPYTDRAEMKGSRYDEEAHKGRYGARSASLGRCESDRSIEDRYGRGYEGENITISDFFK